MKIARTAEELRRALAAGRADGFVPTMGALHDGHCSLLTAAESAARIVVASIFVNPLQFSPGEDLNAYPRSEEADLATFANHGVSVAFVPTPEEMYPEGRTTTVTVGRLGMILEGEHRPGHFDGVATVCAKLFNLVRPRRAYFGQKDAQQVAVIRRMVTDLNFDTEIEVCPTVRDERGLALSSRNAYLTVDQRRDATVLYRSLLTGRSVLERGGTVQDAEEGMWQRLRMVPTVQPDYAVALDPDTFEEAEPHGDVLLAVAARVGPARLIDNLMWESPEGRAGGGL